jgi:hypothetical protein
VERRTKSNYINDLREFAEKHGFKQAIVLFTTPESQGNWGYVSWGWDRKTCSETKKVADKLFNFLN